MVIIFHMTKLCMLCMCVFSSSFDQNHLITNIQAAKKLEEQLLQVQNQCIEEFESYLESHKVALQKRVGKGNSDKFNLGFEEDTTEISRMDMEVGNGFWSRRRCNVRWQYCRIVEKLLQIKDWEWHKNSKENSTHWFIMG